MTNLTIMYISSNYYFYFCSAKSVKLVVKHCTNKTLQFWCQLIQADLYNGHKAGGWFCTASAVVFNLYFLVILTVMTQTLFNTAQQ